MLQGLERFAGEQGLTLQAVVSDIDVFVHGTTIATNTVIQRNGPKIGLICTEGHRDVLALRDGRKWEIFNLHMTPPDPFIPRYLRRGARERIDYAGNVLTPLDEATPRRRARRLPRGGRAGRGGRAALVDRERRARARDPRDRAPRAAGRGGDDQLGHPADDPRVAAHVRDRALGVHQARHLALPERPRARADRAGPPAPAADHAGDRRHVDDPRDPAAAGLRDGLRPGGGAGRGRRRAELLRDRRLHRRRHGRHELRRGDGDRRAPADHAGGPGRLLPDRDPGARGALDRRGRGQRRVDRLRGRAARRPEERRIGARPGGVRARRHRADGDRRQPRARLPRRGQRAGRHAAAAPRPGRAGDRDARRGAARG